MNNLLKFNFWLGFLYILTSFVISLLSISENNTIGILSAFFALFLFTINCFTLFLVKKSTHKEYILISFIIVVLILNFLHLFANGVQLNIPSIMSLVGPIVYFFIVYINLERNLINFEKSAFYLFIFLVSIYFIFRQSSAYIIYGGAIHSAYYILFALPICLYNRKLSIKYVLIFITLLSTFLSYKRGAVISTGIYGSIFLVHQFINSKGWQKFLNIILSLLLIIMISNLLLSENEDINHMIMRFSNLEESGGSGRDEIYTTLINNISNFSFDEHFFGKGMKATKFTNSDFFTAHNDWLEIYYDFGIITFFLWLLFFIKILKMLFKSLILKTELTIPLIGIVIIFFTTSLFSHIIFYTYNYIYFLSLAFFIQKYNSLKQKVL